MASKSAAKRGPTLVKVDVGGNAALSLYTTKKVAAAYADLAEFDLFVSTRIQIVVAAAYAQGSKDGARAAFEAAESAQMAAQMDARSTIPHMNPGRPRKTKKKASTNKAQSRKPHRKKLDDA